MLRILYTEIDLIGIAILMLMYYNFGEKKRKEQTYDQRLFDSLLIANVFVLIFDAGMWLIDGKMFTGSIIINYVTTSFYYILQPIICFLWVMYTKFKINDDKKALNRKIPIYTIPIILTILLVISSYHTSYAFSIDAQNNYERGKMFFVCALLSYIYFVYSTFFVYAKTKSKTLSSKKELRKYLLLFPIPPFIGALIQTAFFGPALIWICTAISLMTIYFNVQNQQMTTDYLTGLNNRRRFNIYTDEKIKSSKDGNIFLIIIDVDKFKLINDIYGHVKGDEALRSIADILRISVRESDFIARLGGDEFIIVGNYEDINIPSDIVELLKVNIQKFNNEKRAEYTLGISAGISLLSEASERSADGMIKIADKRMYEDKESKA